MSSRLYFNNILIKDSDTARDLILKIKKIIARYLRFKCNILLARFLSTHIHVIIVILYAN